VPDSLHAGKRDSLGGAVWILPEQLLAVEVDFLKTEFHLAPILCANANTERL